jgi:hypothetical protein
MQHLFRAANTIEHLKVSIDHSTKTPLLQALGSVDVLPRLRRLEVYDPEAVMGDCASLLDPVAWRRTHGLLESFELVVFTDTHWGVPSAVIAEFRALGEAGLEVRIMTRRRDDPTSFWIPSNEVSHNSKYMLYI